MPLWSNEEWRARIGSSWCALGRPALQSKSSGSHTRRGVGPQLSEVIVIALFTLGLGEHKKLSFEWDTCWPFFCVSLPGPSGVVLQKHKNLKGGDGSASNFRWMRAVIMVASLLLATAVTLASLLLRCGDVERNPGPEQSDLHIDKVDASQVLGEDDLADVMGEVRSLKAKYYPLGRALRLKASDLDAVREQYPRNVEQALNDVLILWLRQQYTTKRFGVPTWRMLVEAVDKEGNHALAKDIARRHPAISENLKPDDGGHVHGLGRGRGRGRGLGLVSSLVPGQAHGYGRGRGRGRGRGQGRGKSSSSNVIRPGGAISDMRKGESHNETQTCEETVQGVAVKAGVEFDTLSCECSHKALIDLAKLRIDWKVAGEKLGLTVADLEAVQESYRKERTLARLILKKWKKIFGSEATNQTLTEVAMVKRVEQSYREANKRAKGTLANRMAKIIGAVAGSDECSHEVLTEVAKVHMDWRMAGEELRLTKVELNAIQEMYHIEKTLGGLTLKKWKKKFGSEATNQILINVALVETIEQSYRSANIGAEDTLAIHVAKIIGADKCRDALVSSYLEQNDERTWPPVKATNFVTLALINDKTKSWRKPMKSVDEVPGEKKHVLYDNLFDDINELKQKFILFEGRPGSGKTTMMNKISRDWANEEILTFNLFIYVPLRRLNPEPDRSLATILRVASSSLSDQNIRPLLSLIEEREGEGVIFAFDGLDEYTPHWYYTEKLVRGKKEQTKVDDVYEILHHERYKRAVKIVSSRPAACSNFRKCAGRQVEVFGFLKAQIKEYIEHYFANDEKKAAELIAHLEEHPNLRNMCFLPLHCAMLAYLYEEESILPETETKFYEDFTISTLLRSIQREHGEVTIKLSSFDKLPSDDKVVFDNVCKLAFNATLASKQVFTSEDVREVTSSDSLGSDSGLGLVVFDRYIMKYGLDETFTFLHLTFQEYLSAVHIAGLSESERMDIIRANCSKKHFPVVWTFLCGMMDFTSAGSIDAFKLLIEGSNKLLFRIHCGHESYHPLPCAHVISSLNGSIKFSKELLTASDCAALGYVISNSDYQSVDVTFDECNVSKAGAIAFLEHVGNHQFSLKLAEEGRALKNFLQGLRKCPPGLHSLELNFSGKKIGDRGAQQLMDLLVEINTSDNLKVLNLNGNNVGVNGFKALQYPNLKQLILRNNQVEVAGVKALTRYLKQCANLQMLDLKDNNVGNDGVQTIGKELKHYRSLKHLVLGNNSIEDDGIKTLAKSLKQYGANLQTLELDENFISDDGVHALGKSLEHCSSMEKLVLGSNNVGDYGARALGISLQRCSKLMELKLNANHISDDGAMAIGEGLKHCTHLQNLIIDLSQNNLLTKGTMSRLTEMLEPHVKILHQFNSARRQ